MRYKLNLGTIILVLFTLNVFGQVENQLGDEYKEAEYDSIHIKEKVVADPRSDPSRKVCDPNAKTSTGNTFKIDNLEVMKNDLILFGEYNKMWFTKAQELCKSLGNGWRLPNSNELKIIFHKKKIIGGFKDEDYWYDINDGNTCGNRMKFDFSGDDDGKDAWYEKNYGVWYPKFLYEAGCEGGFDSEGGQITLFKDAHVRAVRTIQ